MKNAKEIKEGECDIIKNEFSEGIIKEDNEFIKEEKLDAEDSIFKTLSGYGQQEKILKKKFDGKIIVGWKLESKYKIGLGGKWERKKKAREEKHRVRKVRPFTMVCLMLL